MMDEVLREEEAAASRKNGSDEPVFTIFETEHYLDRRRYNAPRSNEEALFTSAKTVTFPLIANLPYINMSTQFRISQTFPILPIPLLPGIFSKGKFWLEPGPGKFSPIHHGGPLTQARWVKTEQNRFNYIRTHQADLRADTYQSLLDFISTDNGSNGPPGKRNLPAPFKEVNAL
ncbi:unnamed protein product [Cylicocyclus nassatus]|uniref:Uncharacterized protein n=1 Tax=Cylicocyclus nassatus TaxID=53992 RepID=A0AA36GH33_CYLNA|nr:unnamed protein product [Cylicocyclus nassatus]